MNSQEALEKLEKLREDYNRQGNLKLKEREELYILYGELEELITRFVGIGEVVDIGPKNTPRVVYPNYISAGLFSKRGQYFDAGYTQLLTVIGKVRQHAKDPTVPQVEYSVTNLVRVLNRFRECCQYLTHRLQEEKDVQVVLWTMLRSHFDRLDKEDTLPRFGVKAYRPDFGIPDLRILVEAKFIGEKTEVAKIQEEVLADIPGYLHEATSYDSVIVFVYDSAQKLMDSRKFIEDLKSVNGIIDVIVIPGLGRKNSC